MASNFKTVARSALTIQLQITNDQICYIMNCSVGGWSPPRSIDGLGVKILIFSSLTHFQCRADCSSRTQYSLGPLVAYQSDTYSRTNGPKPPSRGGGGITAPRATCYRSANACLSHSEKNASFLSSLLANVCTLSVPQKNLNKSWATRITTRVVTYCLLLPPTTS